MSIETLLLVIVFVLVPLIEMFRAARQRGQQQGRPEAEQRRPVPVPRPLPSRMPQIPPDSTGVPDTAPELPADPDVPLVSAPVVGPAVWQNMSSKIAAERRLVRRKAAAESLLDTPARREARASQAVVAGLRSAGGLHRAMVVMAILEPCRAVNPHGWRESDGLR